MSKTPTHPVTVEQMASDCLDVRELRQVGLLSDEWIKLGPSLRWPRIAGLQLARHRIIVYMRNQCMPQPIRVSWTRCHFGGYRPWAHCPDCQKRVAILLRGIAGYCCRSCLDDPIYASQLKSSKGRRCYQASKLRLQLGGQASLVAPFPDRPTGMHRKTYERLRLKALKLEAGLSQRMRQKKPDYINLCYHQRDIVSQMI